MTSHWKYNRSNRPAEAKLVEILEGMKVVTTTDSSAGRLCMEYQHGQCVRAKLDVIDYAHLG